MSEETIDNQNTASQGVRVPEWGDFFDAGSDDAVEAKRHRVRLRGCAPRPLAHYLKAIGLLRLVAEQVDSEAQGAWVDDHFELTSSLDEHALVTFLVERYSPTPIVGPWGGRSGFYPEASEKSAREAMEWIVAAPSPQFEDFRLAIAAAKRTMERLGITSKPSGAEERRLVQGLRSSLPDRAVSYLDATYLLAGEDDRVLPALMGTGGNVGSGSFFSNFMQALVNVFSLPLVTDARTCLFAETNITANTSRQDTGHLIPAGSRGENGSSVGDAASAASGSDSWDLLLAIEGCIAFAGSAARSMTGGAARPRAPFTLRYSADAPGEGRSGEESWTQELILPIWDTACSWNELQLLIAEGRLPAERDNMATLPEALIALRRVGMQRGVSELVRYKFPQRAGQKNLAIESGRYSVSIEPKMAWVAPALRWIERLRLACEAKEAPESIRSAHARVARVEVALLAQQDFQKETLKALMVAMAELQAQMATSWRWTSDAPTYRTPVPLLSDDWLVETCDDSAEFWLAASLASIMTPTKVRSDDGKGADFLDWRRYLAPVEIKGMGSKSARVSWRTIVDNDCCWVTGKPVKSMQAVMHRRLLQHDTHAMHAWEWPNGASDPGHRSNAATPAPLWAIRRFVEGPFDDAAFERWLRCAMLVAPGFDLLWRHGMERSFRGGFASDLERKASMPPLSWALFKLCFAGHPLSEALGTVPLDRSIVAMLGAGQAVRASARAVQRLRSVGVGLRFDELPVLPGQLQRISASLVFPLRQEAVESILLPAIERTTTELADDESIIEL